MSKHSNLYLDAFTNMLYYFWFVLKIVLVKVTQAQSFCLVVDHIINFTTVMIQCQKFLFKSSRDDLITFILSASCFENSFSQKTVGPYIKETKNCLVKSGNLSLPFQITLKLHVR